MRVTNNMLGRNLLYNLGNSAARLQKLQDQMSSGKKITKPSDDPVGIQNAMRYKTTLTAVELWKSNTSEAIAYMQSIDSTLTEVSSMLQRVRVLAVQGANGDLSAEQRATIAAEVRELNEQIRMAANTKIGNRYVFAGEKNVEPMPKSTDPSDVDSDANSTAEYPADPAVVPITDPTDPAFVPNTLAAWEGSEEIVKYQVGNNLSIEISVNGKVLFPYIFAALNKLANALENNEVSQVNSAIGDIDDNIDNLLKHQAELGARVNRLTSVQTQLENTYMNLESNISSIEDLDYAQAIVDYQTQDNAYRAALAVGMKIIQPSLIDFMR